MWTTKRGHRARWRKAGDAGGRGRAHVAADESDADTGRARHGRVPKDPELRRDAQAGPSGPMWRRERTQPPRTPRSPPGLHPARAGHGAFPFPPAGDLNAADQRLVALTSRQRTFELCSRYRGRPVPRPSVSYFGAHALHCSVLDTSDFCGNTSPRPVPVRRPAPPVVT